MHPARRIGKWGACFQGRYCCCCSSVSEERLLLSASAWTPAWPYLCAARRSWLFAFWKLASDATRRVKDSLRRRARLTWSQTSRRLPPNLLLCSFLADVASTSFLHFSWVPFGGWEVAGELRSLRLSLRIFHNPRCWRRRRGLGARLCLHSPRAQRAGLIMLATLVETVTWRGKTTPRRGVRVGGGEPTFSVSVPTLGVSSQSITLLRVWHNSSAEAPRLYRRFASSSETLITAPSDVL